ncbi:glycoside hydrolase family 1 protein [Lacticaseibacillus jixianensis]|uniref:Glycoside hydrolase family 1 protein n=1 Tax=Lacticaseibacillus jixianensis TaxID=2486012 RepID=A0ABW4B8U5_9LACO|nr:glycoside hydrolase family 1 protein [Lacticaseibacillus jixianensis]
MSQALPKGFLWGNSTSSMQTEGGWNEGGKGKSVYDDRPASKDASDWHVAIDDYHRYDEDIKLMADQGMNAYRFQISWSRVCPTGDGDFNAEGIKFYSDLIDKLIAAGITPMICLYHFDMPLALAEKYNGFASRHVVEAFVRYGKKMIDEFADRVPYWITFNEQNLYFMPDAYRIAGDLDGERSDSALYTISHHVMVAHAEVANYLHAKSAAKIGGMLAYSEVYPASSAPRDILYARQIDEFFNKNLLDVFVNGQYSTEVMTFVKNHAIDMDFTAEDKAAFKQLKSDFIAFSYYRSGQINSDKVPINTIVNHYLDYGSEQVPGLPVNEWGWNVDPLGFRDILTKVYDQYHVPMFPIENGIGVREQYTGKEIQDDYRIAYHRVHIQALKDAVNIDGVDVIGYLGWGLIDIPSSSGNMDKRYGMVYVNRTNSDLKDLKRVPKKSYAWFKHVIATNGANLD